MYVLGILKSFSVTLRRFLLTYWDDIRYLGRRSWPENLLARQGPKGQGIFTVQYPQEKLPLPENFRVFPFQILDPETGKRVFTDDDADALGAKSAKPMQRLFSVARRLSALSEDDIEELVKNSESAPTDSSDSP